MGGCFGILRVYFDRCDVLIANTQGLGRFGDDNPCCSQIQREAQFGCIGYLCDVGVHTNRRLWYVFQSHHKGAHHRWKFGHAENPDHFGRSNHPGGGFAILCPNPFSNVGGRRLVVPRCSAVQSLSQHKGPRRIRMRQTTRSPLANFATPKSCVVKIATIIRFSGSIR